MSLEKVRFKTVDSSLDGLDSQSLTELNTTILTPSPTLTD